MTTNLHDLRHYQLKMLLSVHDQLTPLTRLIIWVHDNRPDLNEAIADKTLRNALEYLANAAGTEFNAAASIDQTCVDILAGLKAQKKGVLALVDALLQLSEAIAALPEPDDRVSVFKAGRFADAVVVKKLPDGHSQFMAKGVDDETTRRIVACINACAGIKTDALERLPVPFGKMLKLDFVRLIEAADAARQHIQHNRWVMLQSAATTGGQIDPLFAPDIARIDGMLAQLNDALKGAK